MSANDIQTSPTWKKPDEVMQLLRLKQKKRSLQKLQERMRQPSQSCPDLSNVFGKAGSPNFSRILAGAEKRKNPFLKNQSVKVFCKNTQVQEESTDNTLYQLLGLSDNEKKDTESNKQQETTLTSFTNILNNLENKNTVQESVHEIEEGKKYIPVDWTLKTRMRFMSPQQFAWNQNLKASEEASGITGFVRCLDTSNSSTLDTSHNARFHQNCLYWQHPNLPSMNLFPRTNGRISNRNFISSNDEIKNALHKEWTESFRSLFQLLRARQCPYFYVCANTFTCLFRAAGVGGIVETCAFVAPTTRGFRQMLQQEEIEFTMPMKRQEKKKSDKSKSDSKDIEGTKNSSTDSCYDTDNTNSVDDNSKINNVDENDEENDDDDDMESEEWLQSLGVTDDIIKNINHNQMKINQATESLIDSSAESLVCVRGVDAQALFNFLLNCKSSISLTGTYGGIPPTLLSPTAFQGSTLKCLKVRHSTVHSEHGKYFSVELRGPILPTTLHSLCSLIQSNSNPYSGTFANHPHTTIFSKVARAVTEDEKTKEHFLGKTPSVFGRENLSDCGLNTGLLQHFCSSEPSIVETIDALKYCSDKETYMWS